MAYSPVVKISNKDVTWTNFWPIHLLLRFQIRRKIFMLNRMGFQECVHLVYLVIKVNVAIQAPMVYQVFLEEEENRDLLVVVASLDHLALRALMDRKEGREMLDCPVCIYT